MARKLCMIVLVFGVAAVTMFSSVQLATPAEAAATSLSVGPQTCSAGRANVTFSWRGVDAGTQQIWLDLTIFDNGWEAGTFIGAGPLSGAATSYTWNGLDAGREHFFRVNQQLADGSWDASATARFTTTSCAVSSVAPPAPSTSAASSSGPTFVLVGFSVTPPTTTLPPGIVKPGGVLQACRPQILYAFVTVTNLSAERDVAVSWLFNGAEGNIPKRPYPLKPGNSTIPFSISGGGESLGPSGTQIGLRLSSGLPVPELEGSVTLRCD